MPSNPPVIDGHNDTLTKIHHARGGAGARSFLERADFGHLDLPRAREGRMAGGFFAIFTTSKTWKKEKRQVFDGDGKPVAGAFSVPLPEKLDRRIAARFTQSIMSELFRLVEKSDGAVEVVRTSADLRRCLEEGIFAVILHIEGVEAIDTKLEALDVYHAAGLRSLGPVWSRPNAFGHGVPFDFPRHPDTGPGLTPAGKRLVRRCNELGIMIDCSHLNAQGFWDVARISHAPIVATHSNAHALCPSPRNLTDAQLDVVALSGGVVGLNYAVGFLRDDGDSNPDTPLAEIARHARYMADHMGVENVALGSDFDGAMIPAELGDVSRLPRLLDAPRDVGLDEEEVAKIAYENWVRVLDATWHN